MNRHNSIIFIIAILLLSGCINFNNRQLELALQTAGSNRQELEKVMQHYKVSPR